MNPLDQPLEHDALDAQPVLQGRDDVALTRDLIEQVAALRSDELRGAELREGQAVEAFAVALREMLRKVGR